MWCLYLQSRRVDLKLETVPSATNRIKITSEVLFKSKINNVCHSHSMDHL